MGCARKKQKRVTSRLKVYLNHPTAARLFGAMQCGTRNAVRLLARQLAFEEMGKQATAIEVAAHLKEYQTRLVVEAEKLIATSSSFADWRFPRGD